MRKRDAERSEITANTFVSADDRTDLSPAPLPPVPSSPTIATPHAKHIRAVNATPSYETERSPRSVMQSERSSRRDRHASLRRKVHKSQRKEKRATKTLGIVVGKLESGGGREEGRRFSAIPLLLLSGPLFRTFPEKVCNSNIPPPLSL